MNMKVDSRGVMQKAQDDAAWTEDEARRMLQSAFDTPPPDPALLSRVEKRVLERTAAEGPLRVQRQRLAGWIALWVAAYLLLLLGCAWFGGFMRPMFAAPSQSRYQTSPYTGDQSNVPSSSYSYPGERTRP